MSAKRELQETVETFSEPKARKWLQLIREDESAKPKGVRGQKPSLRELAMMPARDREQALKRWPAEADPEEVAEWDKGTGADTSLIDD